MKNVKKVFAIIGIVLVMIIAAIMLLIIASCANRQRLQQIEKWTTIEEKGEVIYIGPTEYVDEDYEVKELMDSKYNWSYNRKSGEFDKTPRHKSIFTD